MPPVEVWCEIHCSCCGAVVGGWYERGIIGRIRRVVKERGWIEIDGYGSTCQDCAAKKHEKGKDKKC